MVNTIPHLYVFAGKLTFYSTSTILTLEIKSNPFQGSLPDLCISLFIPSDNIDQTYLPRVLFLGLMTIQYTCFSKCFFLQIFMKRPFFILDIMV